MKRAVGMLSVLLALLTGLNAVTPFMSDSIRAFFSIEPQAASVDGSAEDYTVNDVENTAQKASGKKQVAYDGKKILIYDYNQLLKIGSGKSHKYEDGVSATYSADAEYKLARDIALPRHTAWKLPDGFKGSITGTKQKNRNLYDAQNDRIYVYNPYQLAVMAMDNADSQPVMSGDSTAAEFGKGKVISTDKKGKNYLTYDGDHNYVISASFSSKINEKPESVVSQKAAAEPVGAKAENSAGAADDGRDFPGQVIKKIDGKTYILIGNEAQLRAIGSGKDVYSAIYQVNLVGVHFEPDTSGGEPVMLYGGDADLLQSQNDKKNYGFQEIDNKNPSTLKYYASVNQETGKTYLDAGHTSLTQSSDITTGEKYTTTANYIIFRNIDLGGQSRPWKPLMFSGTMYGAKTENGEKLWNGSTNTNATALTATAEVNRPQIQNIYVNTNLIYNDQKLRVNDFIGVGFFATITNQTNASNYGISGGTAVVKNLDLDDVHVENHANKAVVDETLLNAVTTGLGTVVGALVDALLRVLSLGATSTDLESTLSNLLNARVQDVTIYSTGAFAGRIYGDAVVEDCRVKGTVEVSNVKDRTGGFAGYTEGLTEYSGLSTALGAVSNVLATLLNAVPGLGLGDLVTVLLENALPIDKLIPTDYIAPHLKNCEVNGLTGDVGTTGTNMAGGFVGQQIGTRIEDCSVTDSNYNVKAKNYGGGFTGLARDAEIKGTLDGAGIDLSSIIQNIHPQSILIDCEINDSEYQVTGENILGGFAGALTSSYAVDCTIDCQQKPVTVHGTGNYAGGFAGYATVGWQSNLGKSENNENSLLGTVKQLVTGLLSEDQAAGQKLLSLMGISPSAILGCQIYSSELNVEADKSFAGGIVGKGEGIYLGKSDQAAYDALAEWNSGTIKETPQDKAVILEGLKSVKAHESYAGGVAGYMGSAAFQGMLNDVVGLGDFIGFTASDITVTGVDGGYTVSADDYNAGGFGGGVMNGTVKNSNVTGLNTVYAPNYSGGFIGHMGKNGAVDVDDAQVAGPLAGLNAGVLDVFGTVVDDCNVTGIDAGAVIMATGGSEPISGGFAGYADVSQIKNSHVKKLKQVYSDQIAGGFVGKTNMNYLVSAEVDSALVQQVLGIVNGLIRILQIDDLEKLDLLNLDLGILDLKLLTDGDVLYVNLLGLRIGVSLVKQGDGTTGTAVITIGDSTVELPYNENGIDTNAENAEIVVNLIKGNRTRVDNCSAEGILDGYDVYGGGASNTEDGTDAKGYAGGFVGYNKEGKFTSNNMVYCDVIRGTAKKTGIFSGTTTIDSVYSFNNLASIEKVDGEENRYSVYRNTNFVFALTARNEKIGYTVTDSSTGLKRFVVTHLESPIVPGANESDYYKIFEKWNGAKITSNASGDDSVLIRVYVDSAKAVLMLDTPTYENDESLIPNPGESKDPCGNIDLTIQKIWNDKNDADKSRPDSIRVRIWQNWENENGTPVMDGANQKSVLFTDTDIIPDVDTTDGWFTLTKADHGRPGSATWTRVIKNLPVYINESDETVYFSYTVEEAPVFGYSSEITYDETGATATATIVNTPKEFEIQFKYYDRYEIDGIPSGIESEETVYSVPIKNIPKEFITYDSDQKVEAIDFWPLIGEKAVEFSENRLAVNNVMCKYDLWTSQGAAAADMRTRTYFVDGTAIRYGENTTYHTDYLGRPVNHEDYAGQEASKNEKWVNYYDSAGNELAERFASPEDYIKVNKIVVWCYNYPRQYNVDIYGANSADDLVEKTVNGGKVYVANAKSADNDVKRLNNKYYYNQRFGEETGNEDQDAGGFIENYGLKRYTDVLPEDYAEESFGEYTFAYWAYNPEGTQIASVEREFWYRVTTDTKLYAVYAKSGSGKPGISISANENDTFVDSSGVSKTRLNILGSVYGASEYDKDVQKLSFVNISLSTQIRDNPDVYTPEKINALFEQYKNQLKEIIKENDEKNGSKQFSSAETYSGDIDKDTREINSTLNLTLTTKGYIYTVVSNGNKPQTGDSTAKLTNKNRVQFTMSYKTSALNINNTGSNGNTCLMYCAALKYKGEWSVSSNCLIYYNGEVVDNTAESWE